MSDFLPTIIWRHKKENLKKCSLSGLENRADLYFFSYPKDHLPNLDNYLLLSLEGIKELSIKDAKRGLFLIDATWRYAQSMQQKLGLCLQKRRLPYNLKTAYPRKQTLCSDPAKGLSSIEALFMAHLILHKSTVGLLDRYYWKEIFLQKNQKILKKFF